MNDQCHSFARCSPTHWIGAVALALSVALAACSTGTTHYGRNASHITGSDHRDGQSDRLNFIERRYSF
jgi:hypothetical protein